MLLTVAVILLASPVTSNLSNARAVVTPPLTHCNIEIGDAHISKNLLKTRGLIAVKVNAKSQCDKPIRDLVLTVEIYKVGLITDHRVAIHELHINELVYANRVIKNQQTYVKCRSNKWTKYYGVAHAEAFFDKKLMKTLPDRSENIKPFQCGN